MPPSNQLRPLFVRLVLCVCGAVVWTGCGRPGPTPIAAERADAATLKEQRAADGGSGDSAPGGEPAAASNGRSAPPADPRDDSSKSQGESPTDPAPGPADEPAAEPAGEPAAEPAGGSNDAAPAAGASASGGAAGDQAAEPALPANPFRHRVDVPDFPPDAEWLNTGGPLRKRDLRGKFVLLDFWTYCCINCIHILPELKKLERAYPNQLVVIGVHSAKFETEKGTKNIEEAILRYEIEHPVVNDHKHLIWDTYGIRSWPTVLLIDPEGKAVWGNSGEIQFAEVDAVLKAGLPYYRERGLLDETPVRFDLLADRAEPTPLRFPGKVLADEAGQRLFIADSNHNRVVVASLDGKWIETIGSGAIGRQDGGFETATFDHPQGMALGGQTLYLADTENHLLRKIDLAARQVTTIAGLGHQARGGWPGMEALNRGDPLPDRWVGKPLETALNSPWALWIHQSDLYIAMAGPHQIWKMPLDESEIGPYAGNGREDIVDGPLLPRAPYEQGYASFAQPSGLTSDGQMLFVADSEGSSIRAVPFDPGGQVRTVVGTADLPFARLFTFGDRDGDRDQALLQHALGVVFVDGQIYVADTYNNKIKVIDAETGATRTVAGDGQPGSSDDPARFDEPAGITHAGGMLYVADTNNHLIRTVDPASGKVSTLPVAGLTPPEPPAAAGRPDFSAADQIQGDPVSVRPTEGAVTVEVELGLPDGWKLNELAPPRYWLRAVSPAGPLDRSALAATTLAAADPSFKVRLPVTGQGEEILEVALVYFYCQEGGEGLCKVGSVVWTVPLEISATGQAAAVKLEHQVTADPR